MRNALARTDALAPVPGVGAQQLPSSEASAKHRSADRQLHCDQVSTEGSQRTDRERNQPLYPAVNSACDLVAEPPCAPVVPAGAPWPLVRWGGPASPR